MTDSLHRETIDRRDLVLGASSTALLTAWLARAALAQDKPLEPWMQVMQKLVGVAKPVEGRITITLPEIAENGNTVPFTITVDSPMTEADYVKTLTVISTGNPVPTIAAFHFTPEAGRAFVSSRLRLAQTQDVVALAEMSTGRFVMSRRNVKVTIGGCGG